MRVLASAVTGAVLSLIIAAPVSAHGLVGRVQSPLPLAVYLGGAAFTVALSFLFIVLRDVQPPPLAGSREPWQVPRALRIALRVTGMVAWLWILAQMIVGGASDGDVSTLFLWVYGWVCLALISALVGPAWVWLSPFATLHDLGAALLRALGVSGWKAASYPEWLSTWPAVVGFVFIVWLELVLRVGNLGLVLVAYTVITLVGMAQFGRDTWNERGEAFSVWFHALGRMAPFGLVGSQESGLVTRRPYLSGLLTASWTMPTVVLVAIGTASILFDGLSQTQPYFDLFGLPPVPVASVILFGFLGIVVGLVWLVTRLVGIDALGAGLIPIATGYIVAHYLTFVLGDGQRIVIALSDPLQLGWDLLGWAFYEPGTDWIPPTLLWTVQLAAVVGGHVLGVWAGHVVAARSAPPGSDVRLRQVPLAVLMVALTATTLWSLGQAVIDDTPRPSTVSVEGSHA